MNKIINDLLKNTPEDPYAYIIGQLQKVKIGLLSLQPLQSNLSVFLEWKQSLERVFPP